MTVIAATAAATAGSTAAAGFVIFPDGADSKHNDKQQNRANGDGS